ncbi:hypothetical protein [Amphibacillus indicireducens]|uniref:XRE/MutR family transcriptional regulator n=1 Tax=Amphibacillus indicireducens TaxID=1076330 RepID=A0ABP7W0V1_9BACI
MTLGKTIKRIRKMKNIKLKNICGNVIEMGNYWRFEQGQISVSADTFYQIINNLNITFEEFEFYHNDFKINTLDRLGKKMIQAFQSMNEDLLKEISEKSKLEYNKTQQIKYKHLHYLSNIYIDLINNQSIDPKSISEIKEYLTNCEQWGYYEVSLFNNILFCFGDLDTILILYKRMNQSYLRAKSLHKTPNAEIMLATNLITLCLEKKSYSKAQEINQFIQEKKIGERSMFARTLLLWCDGIINKIVFNNEDGLKKIQTSLQIMDTLNMESNLKMFNRWTKELFEKNNLSNNSLF